MLTGVLDHPDCLNKVFDIGGSEILTFKSMMLKLAQFRQLKRFIFSVPVLTLRLSSMWLYFVTSTNFSLAKKRTTQVLNNMMRAGFLEKNILRRHVKHGVKIKPQLNLKKGKLL